MAGLAAAYSQMNLSAFADAPNPQLTLLTVPVEVLGSWGDSLPQAARQVILWMRAACLSGVRLLSDRQPARLRIEDHTSGPPAIWLHSDPLTTAWVIVDIGARSWSQLAYQFGHELGHVVSNSWNAAAWPRLPCQWLEESMVEAFSIRGLGHLAENWARDPPFPGDSAYSEAIRQYRAALVDKYREVDGDARPAVADWFRTNRGALESKGALRDFLGPAILAWVDEYEADVGCVEDLGALNRWTERTGLPIEAYLAKWQASCADINAPGHLPARMKTLLGVG